MRKCMEEVDTLIKAGITCIWIKTYEEEDVVNDIRELVATRHVSMPLYSWSVAEGIKKLPTVPGEKATPANLNTRQPLAAFEAIASSSGARDAKHGENCVYILKDLQEFLEGQAAPAVRRYIRDIKEYRTPFQNILLCVSPMVELPDDIAKLFRVVTYELPTRDEMKKLIDAAAHKLEGLHNSGKEDYIIPSNSDIEAAVNACVGMTMKEASMNLAESIVRKKKIDLDFLMENKIQEVKKSGVLDYIIPSITLDDVGGNDVIKEWLYEQKELFDPQAREFGLPMPKGYMATGVPGTAKTMLAEAFAGMMHMPLLSLNMSKIMSKHVGESERKIEAALNTAKACAPCVFLLDECEKLLGGAGAGGSSNRTDGGVTNRVFASILKFMNDNNSGVYIIMTSNDVSSLPPELTRSGRIDAQWYFGLPQANARKEILRLGFQKYNKELPENVLDHAVTNTDGYTGAELKDVVKNCMRKAYVRCKEEGGDELHFTETDIMMAINEVIPVSESSKEKIMALENWCAGRARRTDRDEEKESSSNEPLFGAGMFHL